MPPITFQDLPLNIYMVIFGTGIFVFILSLIFCCYFISKLRHQAQSERFGYREVRQEVKPSSMAKPPHNITFQGVRLIPLQVVLKGDPKKLNLHGTCAVCLEDFKVKDELGVLPCQHAFHRKCLVKWLEVRCVCPMCNKPIAGPPEQHHSIGTLLDELHPSLTAPVPPHPRLLPATGLTASLRRRRQLFHRHVDENEHRLEETHFVVESVLQPCILHLQTE
ncbi:hypothetical protein CCH79_00007075, partial [Gambusia affinis]